ncbi:pyruvate kinase [Halarcobacter ebronensis]|uniref:Pyruvate kinase n=1 Tax=Halarcobacter ebronensis TaxID=1462615 RepID=A0A4Q1AID9_9BACT|nr:pyruvate kinase [Halarcobacter ebronensis]QKF83115.1 pyruvate kinase I [Halarcobacter ebronensis]RXK01390.1 pyruvate kinase [Halarcobacter ebronensis]
MNKKTKIIATLGPASNSIEMIEGLIKAGANVFRLNFSHGTHEYHSETLKNIRIAMDSLNATISVLQDISGPKVRIGDLKEEFELFRGDEITFVKEEIVGHKVADKKYIVSTNYPELLDKVKVDEYIYLYDGTIRAKVIEVGKEIKALVENQGILSSKKGINFPNTVIDIDVITQKDKDDIAWGVKNKVDYFAISFVQNAKDMQNARKLLGNYKGKLIAKIEKFDAVENIDEIIEASDGLMVARGDLGIEVPYYEVPTIQKRLIRKANEACIPVITATQMLLSMTHNERATRAEISDVANAVLDGTDAVMLSEESAVGIDPVNTVKTMANIIAKTEEIYPFDKHEKLSYHDQFDVIQATATKLADDIGAKGIIALTSSGLSGMKISRYRPKTNIFVFTHKRRVLNPMCALWGVVPVAKIKEAGASRMIQVMLKHLEIRGYLDKEATYIATFGYPVGQPGSTNTIKILTPSEMEYYLNLSETKKK